MIAAFTHTHTPLYNYVWALYKRTLLPAGPFTRRGSKGLLLYITEALTNRPAGSFKKRPSYAQALSHRGFDTPALSHTGAFTHRPFSQRGFYAQALLHTTHRRLPTSALTQRPFYTQRPLQSFTHKVYRSETESKTFCPIAQIHVLSPQNHAKLSIEYNVF